MEIKICTKCKVDKPLEDFYTQYGRYVSICKKCFRSTRIYKRKPVIEIVNLDGELWKEILDYPNYHISNFGRIKTNGYSKTNKTGGNFNSSPKLMTPSPNKDGYLTTMIKNEIGFKTIKIHRLVAIHFIPNPENKNVINHINGIKIDNSLKNLEWCTMKENVHHAWNSGLCKAHGMGGPKKLTEQQIQEIRNRHIGGTTNNNVADLAKEYGVHTSHIFGIVSMAREKAKQKRLLNKIK